MAPFEDTASGSLGRRLALASMLVGLAAAYNALAADAVSSAEATVVAPIAISNTAPLSFGKFSAGSGGTVVLSPAGVRSSPGGVVLLAGSPGNAATFNVTGDSNAGYAITLPAGSAVLTHESDSARTMSMGAWISEPSGTGRIPGTGPQAVTVGATLTVGEAQAPGRYSGSFNLSVEYN